jgi:hypothetical protein
LCTQRRIRNLICKGVTRKSGGSYLNLRVKKHARDRIRNLDHSILVHREQVRVKEDLEHREDIAAYVPTSRLLQDLAQRVHDPRYHTRREGEPRQQEQDQSRQLLQILVIRNILHLEQLRDQWQHHSIRRLHPQSCQRMVQPRKHCFAGIRIITCSLCCWCTL